MKYLVFILTLSLTGCASLKDHARSRELLEQCEYKIEKVYIEKIDFDDLIRIAGMVKDVDFRKPGPEVIPLLNELRKLNFDLNFKTLDINTTLSISNPSEHEVIVDSIAFDALLDGIKVANVIHDGKSVVIPPESDRSVDLIVTMPTSYRLNKVLNAEKINLQGKIWLKIELMKGLPVTLPFKFDVTKDVPREQIQALINEQKKKVLLIIGKEIISNKAKSLFKKD